MVERHAVLQTVRPTRIFGDVATNGAGGLARWVGCVVQTVRGRGARQRRVHRARLDDRAAILGIDGNDAAQPVEADDDGVALGERATGEPGTRAARHKGDALLGQRPDDRDQLLARLRKDGQCGSLPVERQPVGAVRDELARAREDRARPDDRRQADGGTLELRRERERARRSQGWATPPWPFVFARR